MCLFEFACVSHQVERGQDSDDNSAHQNTGAHLLVLRSLFAFLNHFTIPTHLNLSVPPGMFNKLGL
jgi:hypothetical protein